MWLVACLVWDFVCFVVYFCLFVWVFLFGKVLFCFVWGEGIWGSKTRSLLKNFVIHDFMSSWISVLELSLSKSCQEYISSESGWESDMINLLKNGRGGGMG